MRNVTCIPARRIGSSLTLALCMLMSLEHVTSGGIGSVLDCVSPKGYCKVLVIISCTLRFQPRAKCPLFFLTGPLSLVLLHLSIVLKCCLLCVHGLTTFMAVETGAWYEIMLNSMCPSSQTCLQNNEGSGAWMDTLPSAKM